MFNSQNIYIDIFILEAGLYKKPNLNQSYTWKYIKIS